MVVDIICTLCTKDYRNQLLLAMVKDGFLEGVQILVDDLGADVDCERDGNTPICLAVEYKYKNIVKYLLSKVRDFLNPLHLTFPSYLIVS